MSYSTSTVIFFTSSSKLFTRTKALLETTLALMLGSQVLIGFLGFRSIDYSNELSPSDASHLRIALIISLVLSSVIPLFGIGALTQKKQSLIVILNVLLLLLTISNFGLLTFAILKMSKATLIWLSPTVSGLNTIGSVFYLFVLRRELKSVRYQEF